MKYYIINSLTLTNNTSLIADIPDNKRLSSTICLSNIFLESRTAKLINAIVEHNNASKGVLVLCFRNTFA